MQEESKTIYGTIGNMRNVNKISLNNGTVIDQLGYGTWQIPSEKTYTLVVEALEAGYRSIDTAAIYGNEEGVGRAVRELTGADDNGNTPPKTLAREDIFVTSKLWNDMHGYDNTFKAFEDSMKKLGFDYLDMYLIHWATPARGLYKETWKAFEELYDQGRVRAIGVSNFTQDALEDLLSEAKIVPVVNQIELHPFLQQSKLRAFHEKHGIVTEAWSPLGQGKILENETLRDIAHTVNRTVAQVILRWHMQIGTVVIPKSSSVSRMEENIDIFDFSLDEESMDRITALNHDQRFGPDPAEFNTI